jgi:hypothetical protein
MPSTSENRSVPSVAASTTDSNEFGLEVLHHLGNTGTIPVQIIFLHGLGGSKRGTWKFSESQDCWPEWLHSEEGLEGVRIALFAYDASFKYSKPNTNLNIGGFATQLLLAIKQLHHRTRSVLLPLKMAKFRPGRFLLRIA